MLTVLCSAPLSTHAAETEPHYGWFYPPRDGARGINAAVNDLIEVALADVNKSGDASDLRCEDVAVAVTARLSPTAAWFFLGITRSWDVDFSPATSHEYVERLLPISIYRNARLFPSGHAVPVDPAVRVGDIIFGTDKIAHFFTNGARYYAHFNAKRGAVGSVEAEAGAIALGIYEERTVLGLWASGIFSYADLEANHSGLAFYRGLCDQGAPQLQIVAGKWQMQPFDISHHVTPCWDEAFEPSAFTHDDADRIVVAIADSCDRWRRDPVQRRRAAYVKRGCESSSHTRLQLAIAAGTLPDPRPFNIAEICKLPLHP